MLSVDDFPACINVDNSMVFNINKLNLGTGIATLVENDTFLQAIFNSCENKGTSFLLLKNGYTLAMIPNTGNYYLFKSHSRDERGLIVSNGTSVLLKFSSLLEIEKYIQVIYLEYRTSDHIFF